MGETRNRPFQFDFGSVPKVHSQRSLVASDAGLQLVRALDERLWLSQLIAENLTDASHGKNTTALVRSLTPVGVQPFGLLRRPQRCRTSIARPNFRSIGLDKIWERGAVLPSPLHSFGVDVLAQFANLCGPATMSWELITKVDGQK